MNRMPLTSWAYIDTGAADAYTNMALDEVYLRKLRFDEALPMLRVYTWSAPCISAGYFQNVRDDFDLDLCSERGWKVVRRLTGGRAVFHDQELTYSILLPFSGSHSPRSVLESYRYLSEGLLLGLRELGVDAEQVCPRRAKKDGPSRTSKSPDCFASPSWYEISVEGKKIIGSAQRRMSFGLLQQGSILISTPRFKEFREVFREKSDKGNRGIGSEAPSGMTSLMEVLKREVSCDEIKEALSRGFRKSHGIRFVPRPLTPDDQKEADDLVLARYGTSDWNLSRKPAVF